MTLRVVDHMLRLLKVFFVLPFISPADLGLYRFTTTLMGYLPLFQGGFFTTMLIQLPKAITAGDKEKQAELLSISTVAAIVGSVFGIIFLLIAVHYARIEITSFWLVLGGLSFFVLPSNLVSGYLGVSGKFLALSKIGAIASVFGFAFSVIGVWFWGVSGLLLSSTLPPIILFTLGVAHLSSQKLRIPTKRVLVSSTKSSITFFISSSITSACRTGDIIALGYLLGPTNLAAGMYVFGAMVGSVVESLVSAVGQVYSLKILRMNKTDSEEMSFLVCSLTAKDCLFSVCLGGAILIVCTLAVTLLLPKYLSALSIVPLFISAIVLLRWRTYAAVVLNSAGLTRWINISAFIAIGATAIVFGVVHFWFDDSILGYSYSSLVTYFTDAFFVNYFAFRHLGKLSDFWKFRFKLLIVHSPLLVWMAPFLYGDWLSTVLICSGVLIPLSCLLLFNRYFPGSANDVCAIFKD